MKFIELFAGIGGFRYGLERTRGFECVWANDIEQHAARIYRYHWNDGTMHEQDIRTVDVDALPEHQLICGGFPCQSFSIAGKRGGFEDTRGTLFFEICRIARAKRTQYLLLENVNGLLNHDSGKTFQTIIGTLDELGYDCQWQVFDSRNHKVPQHRERVFIIGHLRIRPRPQIFPIREVANENNVKYKQFDISGKGYKSQQDRLYQLDGCMGTLPNYNPSNKILIDTKPIRRLTPIECERLQGFPDDWTKYGDGLIPDEKRYKALGNALTTNIVTEIGERLSQSVMQLDIPKQEVEQGEML